MKIHNDFRFANRNKLKLIKIKNQEMFFDARFYWVYNKLKKI
jgi:hypothetical protein